MTAAVAACGGGADLGPGLGPPAHVPAILVFDQSPSGGVAGATLEPPVRVLVEDGYGNVATASDATVALHLDHGTLLGTSVLHAVSGSAVFADLHVDEPGVDFILTASSSAIGEAISVPFDIASRPADPLRSTITADPSTVAVGESSTIRVYARDDLDNPVAGATVVLSASGQGNTLTQPSPTGEAGVASGALRAATAGTRMVTATVNGVALAQQATVSVTGGDAGSISLTPASASLLPGRTLQLTATVRDAVGAPVETPVTWKSSRNGIATVGPDGTVTAIKPGVATITATSGPVQATSEITVSLGPGTVTGLPYCTMGDAIERMDVYVPRADVPRPLAVAVHIHGGGWVSGNRTHGVWFAPIRDRLLAEGFLVVSIDYRLAPTHKWPAQIQDAKCAIRHLRANAGRYGLDPDRIGVVGSSAGGQLAALLGTAEPVSGTDDVGDFQGFSSRVQAVVALSPITDFTAVEELRDDYGRVFPTWPHPDSPEMIGASPITHVTLEDSPFFFVAGEDDSLVLPEQSARMHRRLLDAGVASTLVLIAHADHGLSPTTAPISPVMEEVIDRIERFLDQRLR